MLARHNATRPALHMALTRQACQKICWLMLCSSYSCMLNHQNLIASVHRPTQLLHYQ